MNTGTAILITILVIGLLAGVIIGLYFAFRSTTPASCDTFTTQSKCPDRCTWKDDSCITPCSTYTTQSKCPDRCSWKDDSCVTPTQPTPTPTPTSGPKYCGMKCKTSKDCPSGCGQCLKGICNTSQSVPCKDYSCPTGYKLIPGALCPNNPSSCSQDTCCQKTTTTSKSPTPKPTKPGPPRCLDNHDPGTGKKYNFCSQWCNKGGGGGSNWGCGIASYKGYTCSCAGCNGCKS